MADNSLLTLDDYAAQLLKEKDYDTLSPELETELKTELIRQLNDSLIANLIDKLSDQEVKELNNFLETKPSNEQLQQFIKTRLEDPQSFIAGVLISFRKTYLGLEA